MRLADSRTWLRLAGWALSIAALLFLFKVAKARWSEIQHISVSEWQWGLTAILGVLYGLSLLLLAAAWTLVLRFTAGDATPFARSAYVFSISQLAKYVPGNVFHLLGRQVMLRADGLPGRIIATASLIEIVSMLLSAGTVVAAALLACPLKVETGPDAPLFRYLALAYLVGIAVLLLVLRWLRPQGSRWLVRGFALHSIFFVLMGAFLAMLASSLADASPLSVGAGGVAAWIAGFVTPGAPAGMGVREAAMLLFAGKWIAPAKLLVIVALFRLVTFGGDIVCFALGWVLFRARDGQSTTPG